MKNAEDLSDFDFGFSFIDEEIEEEKSKLENNINENQKTIEELEKRISMLYNSIIPFLDNLCQNPEKKTIYWPNRVEKIQDYKNKLKLIANRS